MYTCYKSISFCSLKLHECVVTIVSCKFGSSPCNHFFEVTVLEVIKRVNDSCNDVDTAVELRPKLENT